MNNTVKDKLRRWCRYQPRTHQDVRNKLYNAFNLRKLEVEALLSEMIEEGLVCGQSFAGSFARDRSKLYGWGARKIARSLKQRQVSGYCIAEALAAIDEAGYNKQLEKIAAKKWSGIKGRGANRLIQQHKTIQYLPRKGYAADEALEAVGRLQISSVSPAVA